MNFTFKFYLAALIFISISAKSQNDNFTIYGKILDKNINDISVSYTNEGKLVTTTVKVLRSVFILKGTIKRYSPIYIKYNDEVTNFLINPGKIKVVINKGSIVNISGKGAKTEIDKLQTKDYKVIKTLENTTLALQKKYLTIYKIDSIEAKKIAKEGEKLQENIFTEYQSFIKNNSNSFQSLEYLRILASKIDFATYQTLFRSLSNNVKSSFLGTRIKEEIWNKKNSDVGKFISDFTIKDINNREIRLSDLYKKKNVLLVFWASWCAPCIEEIKIFKNKYSNSHNVEIVLISSLDKDEAWRNAIKKYDLTNFVNIFDTSLNELYGKYAIPYLPTSILIDKEGEILGRYEGLQTEKILIDIDKLNILEN